jgi:NAD-dependent dihydropyrimidine dehydrogenase PreA subunit
MRIVYCHCNRSGLLPEATSRTILRALASSGVPFEAVPDLCGLSARKDPRLKRLAQAVPLAVAACAPRAVRWLFHAAGATLPAGGVTLVDLRASDPDGAVRILLGDRAPAAMARSEGNGGEADRPVLALATANEAAPSGSPDPWTPWFPVIDFDRCTGCMQCLSFCLFGVFAAADGRLEVAHPERCKTDCPACARVCPAGAILFPKFAHPPINGADGGAAPATADRIDISALMGGDLYQRLRDRNRPGG